MLVHVRWLIARDMPEVMLCDGANGLLWQEEEFLHCLRQRNCIGMIAEHKASTIGFVLYLLEKTSIDVLNIGVHPHLDDNAAMDVYRALIGKLLSKTATCHKRNKTIVPVELSASRLPLLNLLKSMGFKAALDGNTVVMTSTANEERPTSCQNSRPSR